MSEVKQSSSPSKRRAIVIVALLLLGSAGYFLFGNVFSGTQLPPNVIAVSGRIEGDESVVAPKTSGRILELKVREGDQVKAGDVIALLDDEQIRAREQAAQSAVEQAEAQVRAARQQTAVLQERAKESELQVGQAEQQAQGQVRQAEAELAAAEANLAREEAAYKLAQFDREAYTKLAKSGAVSERQGRQAESSADTQAAVVASARRRVESANAAVTAARSALVNPQIRTAQGGAVRQQILQQAADIANAVARVDQARAQLREAQANRKDLQVIAPISGTVATRTAEPGEIVTPGSPLITLVDLTTVYLRGFVPEGQIGRVRVNQRARVYLDSSPNTPVEAYVSRIDPQATFTPSTLR